MTGRRVYVAQERGEGLCKIGHSAAPRRRVAYLSGVTALDLDLAYAAPSHERAPTIERMTHMILQEKVKGAYRLHCNSEWFRVSVPEAKLAIARATKLVNGALGQGLKTSSGMYRRLREELRKEGVL